MSTIQFRTREFPTAPEGDLQYCNGRPGSTVASWLRSVLLGQGMAAGELIQEDYGWGFWLEGPAAVWVCVAYADGDSDESIDTSEPRELDDMPTWHASVTYEMSIFAPRQWFRRAEGREAARQAFEAIRAAIVKRPGVVMESFS